MGCGEMEVLGQGESHLDPGFPGWIQEEPHGPLAEAQSCDWTGRPPPSVPSPLGDPSSAAGPRCRPLPPHVCAARVFLGRRAA